VFEDIAFAHLGLSGGIWLCRWVEVDFRGESGLSCRKVV
jgi:hypothetical protein